MLSAKELEEKKVLYESARVSGRCAEASYLKKIIDMNEGRYVPKPYPRKYEFRGRDGNVRN